MYGAWYEYQRDGRYGLVPYEVFGNRTLIFWNGWFPFLFSNAAGKQGRKATTAASGATKVYSTITFIRGTLDVEKIVREACLRSNALTWAVDSGRARGKNRFVIHYRPAPQQAGVGPGSVLERPALVSAGHLPPAGPHARPARQGLAAATAGRSTT